MVASLTLWQLGATTPAPVELPECGAPEAWADAERLLWPSESRVTSRRFSDQHRGLDIGTGLGDPVWASANGVIEKVGFDPDGYGHYVIYSVTDAQPGMSILYGHLEQVLVDEGAQVQPGMVLGLAGSTGNSTNPHLHYEVRCEKSGHVWYMDPLYYLQKVWWPEWQGVESIVAPATPATPTPTVAIRPSPGMPTLGGLTSFGSVIVVFPEAP